jgi:hypothetical protein
MFVELRELFSIVTPNLIYGMTSQFVTPTSTDAGVSVAFCSTYRFAARSSGKIRATDWMADVRPHELTDPGWSARDRIASATIVYHSAARLSNSVGLCPQIVCLPQVRACQILSPKQYARTAMVGRMYQVNWSADCLSRLTLTCQLYIH